MSNHSNLKQPIEYLVDLGAIILMMQKRFEESKHKSPEALALIEAISTCFSGFKQTIDYHVALQYQIDQTNRLNKDLQQQVFDLSEQLSNIKKIDNF